MKSKKPAAGKTASRRVAQPSADRGDWRDKTLARMRALILEAVPEIEEERKWRKPEGVEPSNPACAGNSRF